jgi:hypothetical protein
MIYLIIYVKLNKRRHTRQMETGLFSGWGRAVASCSSVTQVVQVHIPLYLTLFNVVVFKFSLPQDCYDFLNTCHKTYLVGTVLRH